MLSDLQVAHVRSLERDGRLNPHDVLADARRPESPLHVLYNWDVEAAAEQHWLRVTQKIIRQVEVRIQTTQYTLSAPLYIKDPAEKGNKPGYVALGQLRTEPENVQAALLVEFERVASALQRARAIAVALGHAERIDQLLEEVVAVQMLLTSEAA